MSSLRWHPAVLLEGHGVASGQALNAGQLKTSPYPKGTIAMQAPLFAALGLDLSPFWPGTLNLFFLLLNYNSRIQIIHFAISNGPICIRLKLFRFGRFVCVQLVFMILMFQV